MWRLSLQRAHPLAWRQGDALAEKVLMGGGMTQHTELSRPEGRAGEVVIENVCKTYGAGDSEQSVLQSCDLRVERGKLTVLMGPSNCGKTVLTNLIAGYEQPTSGRILLDGVPIGGPGPDRLVVFQEVALFSWMTVYENVAFGCRVQRLAPDVIRDRTQHNLRKVGLSGFEDKYPGQLSGGMQRRAELARAMAHDPEILILDEPFRGLDAMTRELMQEFYVGLYEESRKTNLFITHEVEEAIFLADKLVIMTYQPGRIKCELDVDLPRPRSFEVLASPRFLEIREQVIQLLYEEAAKAFAAGNKKSYDFVGAVFTQNSDARTADVSIGGNR
jgi:sulfonate transport system ATP-binding protein